MKKYNFYRVHRTCVDGTSNTIDVLARNKRAAIAIAVSRSPRPCKARARRLWFAGLLIRLGLMEFTTHTSVCGRRMS